MVQDRWRRRLGDGACVVDGFTGLGSGKMVVRTETSTGVGNDGAEASGRTL
jgi:hypothetical protein